MLILRNLILMLKPMQTFFLCVETDDKLLKRGYALYIDYATFLFIFF